ncbi:LysR family transcriptional regulator [Rhodoplanes sp. TEM]|uniref:LysR family transcriptional regulator n=1 Tax=Rhodoplanes tepidamans TaxID=200616 RepID=A0ABT5JJY1_RHOTP|nr:MULTISPECIES: LysR family transcriptional regulator [Rhodoplanes]MDC7789619.1 LysR family transcriptional regulator [Rhodoplanes tepidamans]MDC7986641.1 LysR family transcriptional regulator [Rhodoplanes sp. TEM]MDQ0354035.1 DNA-binding transcriptional LysR family regulator [Rhodoplanes tepidamans]
MDTIAAIRSLVAACDTGSLSGAARRLGISQPAVSQQIAAWEQSLGLVLLVRGRDGIRPTEAGRLAASHGAEVLARLSQMQDALAALQAVPEGRLGLSCALLMAQSVLVPVLADLRRSHPKLKIDLHAGDEPVDLAEAGLDLAIQAATGGAGSGTVRKLAEVELCLVASRLYLDRVGRPGTLDDLRRLDYVQYRDDPDETTIVFADGDTAPVTLAFAAQMPHLLLHAVQNHLGFAKAPRFLVADLLARGEVEIILPERRLAPKLLYLIRAPGLAASRRVGLFVDRVVDELARTPHIRLAPDLRPSTTT